jgi:uncharacterized protein (DUF983 family)
MRLEFSLDFIVLLTIIFVILKLTNTINWSWLWVFSPLWISVLIWLIIILIIVITLFLLWVYLKLI